jgi:hypothetical protein
MAFSKARRLANLMSTASDSVPASKVNTVLADDAVTTAKIADDAITTALIADDQITTALIADDAVTSDHLANSINSAITANTAKVTNAITTHTGDVTGGAALTIAVDAVDIPMLSATGSPSSATFLRGDNAWAAVPAGIDIQSSAPSVASEGSLYYNSTIDTLHLSNGTAWMPIDTNAAPTATGGTVTIPAQAAFSTYTYNLGLNFSDNSTDAQLVYTLQSGSLPPGAVLPTAGNTALTGTATNQATAAHNFVIKATDPKGAFATQAYTQTISAASTGGTVTTPTGFRVHTFTSSGTFNPGGMGAAGTISMGIVAGGGAGGGARRGGGGGAGGMVVLTNQTIAEGNITVTIGGGGVNNGYNSWQSGSNTVVGSTTAIGGGRAGAQNSSTWTIGPLGGGSGGGAGTGQTPGAGTAGQGNAGGNVSADGPNYGGGAGGGKGAAGGDGSGSSGGVGGAGGDFNGVTYAGGGGGPGWSGSYGAGGSGGGGNAYTGNYSNSGGQGSSGSANKGGGGGGSNSINNNSRGGAGGSGVVIIKVPV